MATVDDVARWMMECVRQRPLYQDQAAWDIQRHFGKDFVYENEGGNPAIQPGVLKLFRELSEQEVVWERSERLWRLRRERDLPGRQQD